MVKVNKKKLLEEVEDFSLGMTNTSHNSINVNLKIILKALELKERGLKSTDIRVIKWNN